MLLSLLCASLCAVAAPAQGQAASAEVVRANVTIEVVRWADGVPLAGVEVLAGTREGWEDGQRDVQRLLLGDAGRVDVAMPEGEPLFFEVAKTDQSRATLHHVPFPIQPGEHRVIRIEVFPPTLALRGTVFGVDGTPAPGATVQADFLSRATGEVARSFYCETDQDGHFEFEGLPFVAERPSLADAWALRAFNPNGRSDHVSLQSSKLGAAADQLVFELKATHELRGIVTSIAGQPVEAAKINFEPFEWQTILPVRVRDGVWRSNAAATARQGLKTDRDGRFLVPDYLPGAWQLDVEGPGGERAHVDLRDEDRRELQIPLESMPKGARDTLDVKGIVVDESGQPIEGVSVHFNVFGPSPVQTNSAGEFIVPNVARAILRNRFSLRKEGYAFRTVSTDDFVADGQRARFVLKPGLEISGKITRLDSAQLAGLKVVAKPLDVDDELRDWNDLHWSGVFDSPLQTGSGSEGQFKITGLSPGEWELRVEDGRQIRAKRVVRAGDHGVTIRLGGVVQTEQGSVNTLGDGIASLKGRVVDSLTGQPIEGASITAIQQRSRIRSDRIAPSQQFGSLRAGEFQFPALVEGEWRFEVEADGYVAEQSRAIEVVAGEASELTLYLGRRASRRVQIFDGLGERLNDVSVHVAGTNGGWLDGDDPTYFPFAVLGLDDEVLADIPMGDITLHVQPAGTMEAVEFPLRLEGGSTTPIQLRLSGDFSSPRIPLQVTVRDSAGGPWTERFEILAHDAAQTLVARWEVSKYEDEYRIRSEHDWLLLFRRSVPPASDSIIPFAMPPGKMSISLRGDGWEQQGPEVTIVAGEQPDPVTIVVENQAD